MGHTWVKQPKFKLSLKETRIETYTVTHSSPYQKDVFVEVVKKRKMS